MTHSDIFEFFVSENSGVQLANETLGALANVFDGTMIGFSPVKSDEAGYIQLTPTRSINVDWVSGSVELYETEVLESGSVMFGDSYDSVHEFLTELNPV